VAGVPRLRSRDEPIDVRDHHRNTPTTDSVVVP
jgi:hypothetical protein